MLKLLAEKTTFPGIATSHLLSFPSIHSSPFTSLLPVKHLLDVLSLYILHSMSPWQRLPCDVRWRILSTTIQKQKSRYLNNKFILFKSSGHLKMLNWWNVSLAQNSSILFHHFCFNFLWKTFKNFQKLHFCFHHFCSFYVPMMPILLNKERNACLTGVGLFCVTMKVREATSNDPWGPSSSLMSEIADLTFNVVAFAEVMGMVWKRLNDSGKNWRHVYKVSVHESSFMFLFCTSLWIKCILLWVYVYILHLRKKEKHLVGWSMFLFRPWLCWIICLRPDQREWLSSAVKTCSPFRYLVHSSTNIKLTFNKCLVGF